MTRKKSPGIVPGLFFSDGDFRKRHEPHTSQKSKEYADTFHTRWNSNIITDFQNYEIGVSEISRMQSSKAVRAAWIRTSSKTEVGTVWTGSGADVSPPRRSNVRETRSMIYRDKS